MRMKRHRLYGGSLLAVVAVLAAADPARAQSLDLLTGSEGVGGPLADRLPGGVIARGQIDSTYSYPGLPVENVPIPTGRPDSHGFYTALDFIFLTQTWTLGRQTVAYRGFVDALGQITGVPGTYVGSGVEALSTGDFPRRSWMPGFNLTVGYKLDDGTSIYLSYLNLLDYDYHAGATMAAPFFRSRPDLADTFLVAGVFNFPPQFAGPLIDGTPDFLIDDPRFPDPLRGGNFYGIWNGAEVMDIQFNHRFTQWELGARVPLFQTEYSRIYGMAGGRFNWIFERFQWRTVDYDIFGQATPRDVARYNNTLSQRMYGPFFGCGHEVYLGKRFSLSLDVTGAVLMNVIKERAKYKLESNEIQNKLSRDEFGIVPSATAHLNLWWYPIEGVQMRAGYNAWTFFNTMRMEQPIGFNYSSIDPAYKTQVFRLLHGFNAGVGLFF
jgi:hypothetical protein